MKKLPIVVICVVFLAGCAGIMEKQEPICEGVAMFGGQDTTVQIYGVRKVANQTQYRAGYPFNWQWVSKNNFSSTTCDKKPEVRNDLPTKSA
ncbi:phage exclusion lipoprotein Cor [Atlantibacter hermannii]|uniref:phage exclusion lipoprotein Cor n=1 Tax=Atlantibacter hermannii TaxID=565 RepID=UPI0028AD2175|nr:cor protein [Atlantibacter hermannii]